MQSCRFSRPAEAAAGQHDQRLLRLLPQLADSVMAPAIGKDMEPLMALSPSIDDFVRNRSGITGYAVADLQLVIDFKREHWSANLKMAESLRPMTLFAPQKFAGYLAGAQRWVQIGRPRCLNGEWEGFEGKRKPMSNIAAAQQQARSLIESGAVSYDDDTPL